MSRRLERVANAIKKEVGQIVQNVLNDPRLGFITIVRVELSKDLKFAKVYYSVLGDKKAVKNSKEGLTSAKGFIKKIVGDRLKLRFVPEISFHLDTSSEYSVYIAKKIDDLETPKE